MTNHIYLIALAVLNFLLTKTLKGGRGNEDNIRLEVGGAEDLEALRMEVEHADFA